MKGLFGGGLTVSVWPFVFLLPIELIFHITFRQRQVEDRVLLVIAVTTLMLLLGVAVAGLVAGMWNRMALRVPWARSVTGGLIGYALATLFNSAVIIATGEVLVGSLPAPTEWFVLLPLSRYPNVVALAVIVTQVTASLRSRRELRGELAARLVQVKHMNTLLEQAQRQVATDSAQRLKIDVQSPLQSIIDESAQLDDAELANALDALIGDRLRPLAHRLHPVSVRLGLVPALRSLDPEMVVDVPAAVERLDVNDELLDEDVRLQLYRWMRECSDAGQAAHVTIGIRARLLEVSVDPLCETPVLDPVQIAAGLRSSGPGAVVAPLRGQLAPEQDLLDHVRLETSPVAPRLSWIDVLTVPLPGTVGFVALFALSSFLTQFLILPWPPSRGVVLTAAAWVLAPLVVACVFMLLPSPRRTLGGACLVILSWLAVAVSALVAFRITFQVFDAGETLGDADGFGLLRAFFRYTLPGLALVIAHGVQVTWHQRLESANELLQQEKQLQLEILATSRSLDREVAEAIHRNVQGHLAAAVVMIRLAERDTAWPQVVDLVQQEIPDILSRLTRVANGDAEIVLRAPEHLRVIERGNLDGLPSELADDVRRAVSEIAVNAVRHGGATRLTVQIERLHGRVTITCADDGSGPTAEAVPGLGARLLDDIAERWRGEWHMSRVSGGCLVRMELDQGALSPAVSSSLA